VKGDWSLDQSGIDPNALQRFVDEQVYTLPGIDNHRDVLSILLTGSRAFGGFRPTSDVDLDIVCPLTTYTSLQRAAYEAGLIKSRESFGWWVQRDDDWHSYYGKEVGRPHFSLTPMETVENQFASFEDVPIWVWTNARIIADPGGQFHRILDSFHGYPKDVLVRKLKYHYLLAWYYAIDVFPHNHLSDDELLPAATALLNTVDELIRVFFLVDGGSYPYAEKLTQFVGTTRLGRESWPLLRDVVDLVVGNSETDVPPWQRMQKAFDRLCSWEGNPELERLETLWDRSLVQAGVEPEWVEHCFDNIGELFDGLHGPPPQ
jgi:hypothetical protein